MARIAVRSFVETICTTVSDQHSLCNSSLEQRPQFSTATVVVVHRYDWHLFSEFSSFADVGTTAVAAARQRSPLSSRQCASRAAEKRHEPRTVGATETTRNARKNQIRGIFTNFAKRSLWRGRAADILWTIADGEVTNASPNDEKVRRCKSRTFSNDVNEMSWPSDEVAGQSKRFLTESNDKKSQRNRNDALTAQTRRNKICDPPRRSGGE